MKDQKKTIYEGLRRHQHLSVREIFQLYNCNSPTKVISDLRRDGYPIEDRWIVRDGKRWKDYYIREEKRA